MIKIETIRYNLDEIKKYYPHVTPLGNFAIVFEYKHIGSDSDTIIFKTKQLMEKTIAAIDEVSLLVKDGEVIVREMPMDLPFVVGGGGFDPSGGINLQ